MQTSVFFKFWSHLLCKSMDWLLYDKDLIFPKRKIYLFKIGNRNTRKKVWKMFKVKGPISGLRQFLTIESPLKMMKNAFQFLLKALSFLRYLYFLSWPFGYVEKRLDKKAVLQNLQAWVFSADPRNFAVGSLNFLFNN